MRSEASKQPERIRAVFDGQARANGVHRCANIAAIDPRGTGAKSIKHRPVIFGPQVNMLIFNAQQDRRSRALPHHIVDAAAGVPAVMTMYGLIERTADIIKPSLDPPSGKAARAVEHEVIPGQTGFAANGEDCSDEAGLTSCSGARDTGTTSRATHSAAKAATERDVGAAFNTQHDEAELPLRATDEGQRSGVVAVSERREGCRNGVGVIPIDAVVTPTTGDCYIKAGPT